MDDRLPRYPSPVTSTATITFRRSGLTREANVCNGHRREAQLWVDHTQCDVLWVFASQEDQRHRRQRVRTSSMTGPFWQGVCRTICIRAVDDKQLTNKSATAPRYLTRKTYTSLTHTGELSGQGLRIVDSGEVNGGRLSPLNEILSAN